MTDPDKESWVVCAPYMASIARIDGNSTTYCDMCKQKVTISEEAKELGASPVCISCAGKYSDSGEGFTNMPPKIRQKAREKLSAEIGEEQADALMALIEDTPISKLAEMIEKYQEQQSAGWTKRSID